MPISQYFAHHLPFVASESVEGEAVIMNLRSGHYYSARGCGAMVWVWLGEAYSVTAMASVLANLYQAELASCEVDVTAFVEHLLAEGLIITAEAGQDVDRQPVVPAGAPTRYRPPILEVFADMQDLLLLDPIHDTDDIGWPTAKPTRPASV